MAAIFFLARANDDTSADLINGSWPEPRDFDFISIGFDRKKKRWEPERRKKKTTNDNLSKNLVTAF